MVKVTHKIAICLVLALGLISEGAYSNNLTQLDMKKSTASPSTLNVTIFTSSPYDENVAVSKKSDNKYVIIMPNVAGSGNAQPDLSGLSDMVSNVDVKSINDGGAGYTKVTLTTTKPITIRTTTKRSAPLTPEQKAYKNLIAQSRTNKPANNHNNVSASKATMKFENNAPAPEKKIAATKTSDKQAAPKPTVKSIENNNVVKVAQNKIKDTVKSVVEDKQTSQKTTNTNIKKHVPTINDKTQVAPEQKELNNTNTQPQKQVENVAPESIQTTTPEQQQNKRTPSDMITTFAILLCSIFGLTFFVKLIKKSLEHSLALKQSFKDNLKDSPAEIQNYDNIVNNSELSWQEKYQQYIGNSESSQNSTAKKVLKHIGGGEYKFVTVNSKNSNQNNNKQKDSNIGFGEVLNDTTSGSAQLKPKKANRIKSYNKPVRDLTPDNIPPIKKVKNQNLKSDNFEKLHVVKDLEADKKYKDLEESLEKSLHNTPDIESISIHEEDILTNINNPKPVADETDRIVGEMHRARKLKAFANKLALEETKRNTPLPKMRSEIKKTKELEAKHVELGYSGLHRTSRKFDGANLSVGDLIAKGDKFLNSTPQNKVQSKTSNDKYTTVSVDEFFDKIDSSSSVTASASLASRVADSLGKMSTEISSVKKQAPSSTKNPFDGKIVLSGYNIDSSSGFYVVKNEDGQTSLIGRINNDTTLLKNFGYNSNIKLQVRLDSPNVYMVKADNSRYLVEVNNNKMGVLLEL